MAVKNPFERPGPDQDVQYRENLERWSAMEKQLVGVSTIKHVPQQVAQVLGADIEKRWQAWARDSGQLFPETKKDFTGREITQYHGDIMAAFAPWNQPRLKVKVADLVHFEGRQYIAGQEPAHVRRAMLLRKNGFSE